MIKIKEKRNLVKTGKQARIFSEERLITDVQFLITSVMEEKGVSQKKLAEMLEVKAPTVSKMLETGSNLQLRTIAKILHVLGDEPIFSSSVYQKMVSSKKAKPIREAHRCLEEYRSAMDGSKAVVFSHPRIESEESALSDVMLTFHKSLKGALENVKSSEGYSFRILHLSRSENPLFLGKRASHFATEVAIDDGVVTIEDECALPIIMNQSSYTIN
jgi:plasmid maintenance system antidote protein VapI